MRNPVPSFLRIPRPPRVGWLTAYLLAVLIPVVTCAVQYALVPIVVLVPFILFFLAAFLAAWFGGRGPGLVAMTLSALLANYFFLSPLVGFALEGRELVLTVIFLVVAGVVTLLSASVREGYTEQDRLLIEARQAHAELAESNARLRVLAESAGALSSLQSWDETVEAVSRLGLPRFADSVGVDLASDPTDPVDPRAAAPLALLETKRRALDERRALAVVAESEPGRSQDDARQIVAPLFARDEALGFLTFARNHPRRPFDSEDLVLATELARRASFALENARLFRASQEAVSVRDDFLAVAGHELKTPLTALRLQVGALRRQSDRPDGAAVPKSEDRLQRAMRSVDRLAVLVDELLDVSRISAGRLKLERSPVDLSEVVAEHVKQALEAPTRLETTVSLRMDPSVVGSWDRMRIDQIVGNLLSNALKYGEGKEVGISVHAAGDRARLVVRDHGMGISREDQARIFERFERAVSRHHYGGLGLGLWIVRQVVEAHGGTIAVESAQGAGATFVVELPLGEGAGAVTVA